MIWRGGQDYAKNSRCDVIGSERASVSTSQELPSWLREAISKTPYDQVLSTCSYSIYDNYAANKEQ